MSSTSGSAFFDLAGMPAEELCIGDGVGTQSDESVFGPLRTRSAQNYSTCFTIMIGPIVIAPPSESATTAPLC